MKKARVAVAAVGLCIAAAVVTSFLVRRNDAKKNPSRVATPLVESLAGSNGRPRSDAASALGLRKLLGSSGVSRPFPFEREAEPEAGEKDGGTRRQTWPFDESCIRANPYDHYIREGRMDELVTQLRADRENVRSLARGLLEEERSEDMERMLQTAITTMDDEAREEAVGTLVRLAENGSGQALINLLLLIPHVPPEAQQLFVNFLSTLDLSSLDEKTRRDFVALLRLTIDPSQNIYFCRSYWTGFQIRSFLTANGIQWWEN